MTLTTDSRHDLNPQNYAAHVVVRDKGCYWLICVPVPEDRYGWKWRGQIWVKGKDEPLTMHFKKSIEALEEFAAAIMKCPETPEQATARKKDEQEKAEAVFNKLTVAVLGETRSAPQEYLDRFKQPDSNSMVCETCGSVCPIFEDYTDGLVCWCETCDKRID